MKVRYEIYQCDGHCHTSYYYPGITSKEMLESELLETFENREEAIKAWKEGGYDSK